MQTLQLVTPSEALPITLADLKAHLRITHSSEDDYLTELIHLASAWVQSEAQVTLLEAEWKLQIGCFPEELVLPMPPVTSVDSITYFDSDNESQTLSTDAYFVTLPSKEAATVVFTTFPQTYNRPDAIAINFTAGVSEIGYLERHLLRLLAGHFYENREASITGTISRPIALGVERLVNLIRSQRYHG